LRQSAPRPRLSPPAGPLRLCHILTLPRSKPKSEVLRRSASMASTALVAVAVGGGISLGLVASSGVVSCSLRAGDDSRRLARRLVLLRRGGDEVRVFPVPHTSPCHSITLLGNFESGGTRLCFVICALFKLRLHMQLDLTLSAEAAFYTTSFPLF
jgi:hypothetical protein